ncbi:hypothetical protein [Rudaeicoccus suwonensis]|uniref:Uncharacterized protein n=1 Tax=Rudaeicoccus suwonensis TaxID=657409 RepID=A0A561E394_9MICO|nr:hypothetical protein [Rudaeicoccus suwonensis]TWE10086.1 hypothetical protein BKA23_2434 [Rudaeicoccus suwonensis]
MFTRHNLRSPAGLATICAVVFALIYALWDPRAPDLAAQVARANVARGDGLPVWWGGWFGGINLPSYSTVVPISMATFGVRATGVTAVFASSYGGSKLVRDALRPRAGAIAIAVAQGADLLNGRVTFTVGAAVAIWALVALRYHFAKTAVVLSVASFLCSPLAGFFVGLIAVTVAITRPDHRRTAIASAVALLAAAGALAVLFPGTGTMPFSFTDTLPAGFACLLVIAICANRTIRVTAALLILSFIPLLIEPLAIGNNVTRLAWLAAVPAVVAYGRVQRAWLVVAAASVAIWPIGDLSGQLHAAHQPSSHFAFYENLAQAIQQNERVSGSAMLGRRVEMIDTKNHWGTVYMAGFSLARGWDRQADRADNAIFYVPDALNAVTYREWLDSLAVGYVAVPNAPLDYASVKEAALVRSGLPYLKLVWSNPDWQLYAVTDPAPLATGATVTSVDSHGIDLQTQAGEVIDLKVRYSAYIGAVNPTTHAALPACIVDNDGWLEVTMQTSGPVRLTSDFQPGRSAPAGCVQPGPSSSVAPASSN